MMHNPPKCVHCYPSYAQTHIHRLQVVACACSHKHTHTHKHTPTQIAETHTRRRPMLQLCAQCMAAVRTSVYKTEHMHTAAYDTPLALPTCSGLLRSGASAQVPCAVQCTLGLSWHEGRNTAHTQRLGTPTSRCTADIYHMAVHPWKRNICMRNHQHTHAGDAFSKC
jgi:hypothetical protein